MTQVAAAAQNLQVESVLAAMPNGVVMLDSRGFVTSANRVAVSLLGQPLEQRLWRDIIAASFAPRDDDGHEVSLVSGRRVRLDISPLQSHPGQLIVITDMSETRALQARVSQMQRLSAMGRMVASLAHQIRTPLSAALLYAENLCRDSLPTTQRQKFSHKLTDRLHDLEQQVNDMLLFAKSGDQLPVDKLYLNQVVCQVAEQVEPIAVREGINLNVEETSEDAAFVGNLSALTSAVQNLVMNAIQACGNGHEVTLSATCDDQNVHLCVEDNGPGIAEEDMAHIFTPFFTRKSQGTGLGLAVVRSVAKAHHGDVSVTTALGSGSRFTIQMPRYQGKS